MRTTGPHVRSLQKSSHSVEPFRKYFAMKKYCVLLLAAAGCGSGLEEFPVAETAGVVLCEGKPVPFARVQFNPQAREGAKSANIGKPGFAFADAEGKFVLTTYHDGDGAIVGRHVVTAVPDPGNPCNCHSDDITPLMEVDVRADQKNAFEVVIPPRAKGQKPAADPFADPE